MEHSTVVALKLTLLPIDKNTVKRSLTRGLKTQNEISQCYQRAKILQQRKNLPTLNLTSHIKASSKI